MFALARAAALLAASAPGMAAILSRQGSNLPPSCLNLREGSLGTQYNFTLSAAGVSTNTGAKPLTLAPGPPGTSAAASEWVIATAETAGSDAGDWPYWNLVAGVLSPQPGPDEQGLGAYANTVASGDMVTFTVTTAEPNPDAPAIYCAANESQAFYLLQLAVNNNPDGFSLCTATDNDVSGEVVVVYEAQPNNPAYIYDTCYAVDIDIFPYTG